jgi:diphthamide synthase subunit DPH2
MYINFVFTEYRQKMVLKSCSLYRCSPAFKLKSVAKSIYYYICKDVFFHNESIKIKLHKRVYLLSTYPFRISHIHHFVI